MRTSKTLANFRSGNIVRMCALGHYIPAYVKHAAHYGFDCIWLDTEHRNLESHQIESLLALGHLFDIDIMVRARTLEKTQLYRLLEDGASGVMIPHVSTPEKAQMLVDALKFPPIGDRGLDGAGIDADYLCGDPALFPQQANEQTFLVVQIETPQAVENVEAIAAVKGVDALFIGPGDLGLRLKHHDPGWTLEDAYQRVAAACKQHGKAWGAPTGTPEEIAKRKAQGAQILAHGGDFMAVKDMLEEFAGHFPND